ncbi:hypothetical protein B0H10DRAFT_1955046 [Mycena sp. CBHHK59/15]|nr:hypothetical protein B0H10DRAFT_1955046 [Mycena sp. CBHHK59/15]
MGLGFKINQVAANEIPHATTWDMGRSTCQKTRNTILLPRECPQVTVLNNQVESPASQIYHVKYVMAQEARPRCIRISDVEGNIQGAVRAATERPHQERTLNFLFRPMPI